MSKNQPPQTFLRIETGSHSAAIHSLLPLDNGRRLITAGDDKIIRIWDVAARRESRKLLGDIGLGQIGHVHKIAVTPDERYLAAAVKMGESVQGNHFVLRFYDLKSGDLRKIMRLVGTVSALDFSSAPGGYDLAVSLTNLRAIRVYRLNHTLDEMSAPAQFDIPHPFEPMVVKFFHKGNDLHLITADWDNYAENGRISLYALQGTTGDSGLSIEPFRQLLALPNQDSPDYIANFGPWFAIAEHRKKEIFILNLDGDVQTTIESIPHPAGLAFSPNGKFLLAGSKGPEDQYLCNIYDTTANFTQTTTYTGHDGPVRAVAFIDEITAVSAGGAGYEIHFWDARTGARLGEPIQGVGRSVFAVGIQNEDRIAFGNRQRFQLDANNFAPLENVLDLQDFSISPLTANDTVSFHRANPQWESFSLGILNSNLWLLPRMVPLTGWRAGWYFAETFGFTSAGDIVLGERGGQVRVFPRDRSLNLASLGPPVDIHPWDFDQPWDFTQSVFLRGHAAGQVWDHAAQGRWLVTGGNDQVIRLWYLPDAPQNGFGELYPALNIFITNNHEWILWSESGYYAASQDGDRFIGFHVNQGEYQEALFFPSDRFISTLYRPDVIRAILETGSESRALAKLNLAKPDSGEILPPAIELKSPNQISTTDAEITLHFELRPLGKPIQRAWALRNDQFIWQDESPQLAQGAALSVNLPLLPGKNEIKLFAESQSAKSNPTVLIVDAGEAPAGAASLSLQQLALNFSILPGANPLKVVRLERDGETVWQQVGNDLQIGAIFSVSIPLPGKQHHIQMIAEEIVSSQTLLEIEMNAATPDIKPRGDGSQAGSQGDQAAKPNLYMLAVGVSSFQDQTSLKILGLENLDFAHKDAEAISSRFKTQEGKLYAKVYCRTLVNSQATKKNILQELQQLQVVIQAREEEKKQQGLHMRDLTILFLAGHGIEHEGSFYFINYDTRTDLQKTALRLMDLGLQITSLPSDLIVLTDTCKSGMVGRELIRTIDPSELAKRLLSINERAQIILNATTADASSLEGGKVAHGFFTASILEGLQQGSEVMILKLADYVQNKVKAMSTAKQIPTLRTYGDIYPLPIYKK